MKARMLFLLFLSLSATAHAVEVPVGGLADDRIRFVNYDRNNVVRIIAHYGYQTHVEFSDAEEIIKIGAGDTDAWHIATYQNHLFFKPAAERASTNLTVVTSLRVYNFELLTPTKAKLTEPRHQGMYFDVIFHYPQEAAAAALARMEAQRQRRDIQDKLQNPKPGDHANWEYFVQGSEAITPNEVWDDHTFTYLKFANAREMPAVFVSNPDKSESLVNTNVAGDTIIVHRTAEKLVLRKGKLVACLFNGAYDPNGVENTSRTISDEVKRYIQR